jgi:UDPglucose--hexose-1-phosphate uridylyltransferase
MGGKRDNYTTSELRHDWLADRWVIVAPQRTERPEDYSHIVSVHNDSSDCPFCSGHECQTPATLASYYSDGGNGSRLTRPDNWQVRVVPNKFPAVNGVRYRVDPNQGSVASPHFPLSQPVQCQPAHCQPVGPTGIDLYVRRELSGGHEVIIESPLHLQSLSQLDRETVGLVFRAYRDRLAYWRCERNSSYAVVFKNVGYDAGASLAHTHSQLIATDILPTEVQRHVSRMEEYQRIEGDCLFCRMLAEESEQGTRIVDKTAAFTAFCPFASRLPSMVNIVPNQHASSFESLGDVELDDLAWLTHRLIRRIERCFPNAAYNFVIHTAPIHKQDSSAFHWRMELFPRITKVAGFEWGSDCYINPIAPEKAAEALRTVGL